MEYVLTTPKTLLEHCWREHPLWGSGGTFSRVNFETQDTRRWLFCIPIQPFTPSQNLYLCRVTSQGCTVHKVTLSQGHRDGICNINYVSNPRSWYKYNGHPILRQSLSCRYSTFRPLWVLTLTTYPASSHL